MHGERTKRPAKDVKEGQYGSLRERKGKQLEACDAAGCSLRRSGRPGSEVAGVAMQARRLAKVWGFGVLHDEVQAGDGVLRKENHAGWHGACLWLCGRRASWMGCA